VAIAYLWMARSRNYRMKQFGKAQSRYGRHGMEAIHIDLTNGTGVR